MDKVNRPKLRSTAAVLQVWDVFCQIQQKKGNDFNKWLQNWAQAQRAAFRTPQAARDFDELCSHGCQSQTLAVLLSLISNAPKLEVWWSIFAGPPKARRSASKALEAAASTVEDVLAGIIALEDDEVDGEGGFDSAGVGNE